MEKSGIIACDTSAKCARTIRRRLNYKVVSPFLPHPGKPFLQQRRRISDCLPPHFYRTDQGKFGEKAKAKAANNRSEGEVFSRSFISGSVHRKLTSTRFRSSLVGIHFQRQSLKERIVVFSPSNSK